MPPAMIKSLAKKAGISSAKAEELWSKAKDRAKGSKLASGRTVPKDEDKWKAEDYKYVVGVMKASMGMKKESLGEALIELCVATDVSIYTATSSMMEASSEDRQVRVFFDCGRVAFCSLEDQVIEASEDGRIELIQVLVNEHEWPMHHPIFSILDGYEGSLQNIFEQILELTKVVEVVGPLKPRRRSLKQKQGARKAGRTRSRRAYVENKGWLTYEYYGRDQAENCKLSDIIQSAIDNS